MHLIGFVYLIYLVVLVVVVLVVVVDETTCNTLPAGNDDAGKLPVTPVDNGRPVQLVKVPDEGVPNTGVTNVGVVIVTLGDTADTPVVPLTVTVIIYSFIRLYKQHLCLL